MRLLAWCSAVALLGGWAVPAEAQLSRETLVDDTGYGTTLIHNGSPDVLDVQVDLRHGTVTRDSITLGARADAVVSPGRFQLAPGESQVVRLLVREPLPADSVRRLGTVMTPRAARGVTVVGEGTGGTSAELRLATRFITKVRRR